MREHIATACGGDVRKSMNAVELLLSSARREGERLVVTLADAQTVAQRSAMRYDREGDDHYDIASALMKSMRGSDPDAALHYLARLLEAGDMTTAIRRILCSASEDVGMAYPQAARIVKACVDNALQLGLPEARLPLAQAVVLLATAPKSNSVYEAIAAAQADVRAGKTGDYPRHLQNVHADSAGMEREQGYLYPHDFPRHWVRQQYLPDLLADRHYYRYGDNKNEQAARRYWDEYQRPRGIKQERGIAALLFFQANMVSAPTLTQPSGAYFHFSICPWVRKYSSGAGTFSGGRVSMASSLIFIRSGRIALM